MKKDVFAKLQQRVDSAKVIQTQDEFKEAVKDQIQKDTITIRVPDPNAAFVRKTRMGGHLSNTLNQAGLYTIGIPQRNVTFSLTKDNKSVLPQ